MTKKEFKKIYNKKNGWDFIGEFKNIFGEQYVIIRCAIDHPLFKKTLFIAGSETDWDLLILHPSGKYAYKEFAFSNEEEKQILKIISE